MSANGEPSTPLGCFWGGLTSSPSSSELQPNTGLSLTLHNTISVDETLSRIDTLTVYRNSFMDMLQKISRMLNERLAESFSGTTTLNFYILDAEETLLRLLKCYEDKILHMENEYLACEVGARIACCRQFNLWEIINLVTEYLLN